MPPQRRSAQPRAAALVHAWGGKAALLVPADLSQRGWRFEPDDVARSVAVRQASLPCDRIAAVKVLTVHLDAPGAFRSATPGSDLSQPAVADALADIRAALSRS